MVKKCPACGFDNRDDANFCANCGVSLAAPPTVKPVPAVRVVSPVAPPAPIRVPPPGMCYYHPNLPAAYICARCGRAICKYCAKIYGALVFCPECFSRITFIQPTTQFAPAYPSSSIFQSPASIFP